MTIYTSEEEEEEGSSVADLVVMRTNQLTTIEHVLRCTESLQSIANEMCVIKYANKSCHAEVVHT